MDIVSHALLGSAVVADKNLLSFGIFLTVFFFI